MTTETPGHEPSHPVSPRKVFVTGGTGFIGRALVAALVARGDEVTVLSRDAARADSVLGSAVRCVEGDPSLGGDWLDSVAGHDAVINLAGQSVGTKRWNARYRQLLMDSRIETTRYVVEAMARASSAAADRVPLLISSSGIDYYPFDVDLDSAGLADLDDDVAVTESARPGDSFLARVCRKWEAEAVGAGATGARVVLMRTGVVLGRGGGPLAQIAKPFKLLVGGRLSTGRQWFSWIHLDDAVAAFLYALDNAALSGPVNLVAPEPVRNRDFTRALAKALRRPAIAPIPAFALKLAVGEFHEYLIHGRRAVPAALQSAGFEFRHAALDQALDAIYG